jgi:hypothetical protein
VRDNGVEGQKKGRASMSVGCMLLLPLRNGNLHPAGGLETNNNDMAPVASPVIDAIPFVGTKFADSPRYESDKLLNRTHHPLVPCGHLSSTSAIMTGYARAPLVWWTEESFRRWIC